MGASSTATSSVVSPTLSSVPSASGADVPVGAVGAVVVVARLAGSGSSLVQPVIAATATRAAASRLIGAPRG
jgi:hypothetical protein